MAFYSEFSKNYDKIFPLRQKKLSLLDKTFKDLKQKREKIKLLDVGCGTGSYALALAELGYQLEAVDLDPEMISLAESKKKAVKGNLNFYRLGMLSLKDKFKPHSFDGIYLIGNVLVHLQRNEIKDFLKLAAELLNAGAKIFIQIVNYYRILELNLAGLPTIYSQDETVRFERDYKYEAEEQKIYFKTRLIDHFEDQILAENEIGLYPICKSELVTFLKEAGFRIENIYGDFNGDQYRELSSVPLIITAQKEQLVFKK